MASQPTIAAAVGRWAVVSRCCVAELQRFETKRFVTQLRGDGKSKRAEAHALDRAGLGVGISGIGAVSSNPMQRG